MHVISAASQPAVPVRVRLRNQSTTTTTAAAAALAFAASKMICVALVRPQHSLCCTVHLFYAGALCCVASYIGACSPNVHQRLVHQWRSLVHHKQTNNNLSTRSLISRVQTFAANTLPFGPLQISKVKPINDNMNASPKHKLKTQYIHPNESQPPVSFTLQPGKRYAHTATETYKITKASLQPDSRKMPNCACNALKQSKTKHSDTVVLIAEHNLEEHILCILNSNQVQSCKLNFMIEAGEQIAFRTVGSIPVQLDGYYSALH